jgi:hypothetical protein
VERLVVLRIRLTLLGGTAAAWQLAARAQQPRASEVPISGGRNLQKTASIPIRASERSRKSLPFALLKHLKNSAERTAMNKPKTIIVAALALASLCVTSGVEAQQQPAQQAAPQLPQAPNMTFFVTSVGPGKGADLGGLEGADQYCQQLAQRHGAGGKTWRAYLSTQAADGKPAVNARDRIGNGPWQNFKGEIVAQTVDDLHSDNNKLGMNT